MIALGLMSGTSGDGIDAAAVELAGRPRVVAHRHAAFAGDLRARVLAAAEGAPLDARSLARLHGDLGDAYAAAALALLEAVPRRPEVIGAHGQTIAHLPGERVTLQSGDAARVAFRTGVPVVADFRSADVAAGGQGAPLVPYADHAFFADGTSRAVLNLGGIANLTLLPTERAEDVRAFDTGPGNMVIDALAARAGAAMDAGGALASRGR
ncbi:MAG: anhydro-N-acetylmuramic acid kinase, partial [Candidatus Limnocylindria bacterium]